VWHRRSPSGSLRGAAVRAACHPGRDARVFRPCSRDTGLPCDMDPLFAGSAAADSLRLSAGGADERDCASGARCHPAIRSDDPLVATPASLGLDPAIHGAGLTLHGSESRAPSTDSTWARSGANLFVGHLDRGACSGLSTFACPEHPCCAEDNHRSRPDRWSSSSLDVAPRTALRRFLGRERQDASNQLLQPTFT